MKKIIKDTGGGCSICGQNPAVNVSGTYWLCGDCVSEKLETMKTSIKLPAVPKCGTFMGIKDVHLYEVNYTFSQNSDTNQKDDCGQVLKVSTDDSGGGCYIIIETERWAMDSDEIDKFCNALKKIVNTPEEYEK